MAHISECIKFEQLIKALKKFEKEDWKLDLLTMERPTVDDPLHPLAQFMKTFKAGPAVYINITLINKDPNK